MADETVVSGASSPAAESTGAASSASVAVAEPPAVETTTPEPEISDPRQYLRDELAKVVLPGREATPEQKAAQDKAASDKAAADKLVSDKAAADAKAAEDQKTEEQKAAEKAAADAKAAESKPADPLDKLGPLPAEQISSLVKDPEFKAVLDKFGVDAEKLLDTCRGAAEAELFHEAGVATPEQAALALEHAGHFYDIDEGFPQAGKDLKSFDDFMSNVMLPLSIVRDANGQPIPDPKNPGQFQTDGTVSSFMERAVEYEHQAVSGKICATQITNALQMSDGKDSDGNPTFPDTPAGEQARESYSFFSMLQAGVDMYEEFRKNGYKMPNGQKPAELSPEHKAEMDKLRARDAEVTKTQTETRQQQEKIWTDQQAADTLKSVDPLVSDVLNGSSLTPELKTQAGGEIWAELGKKMDGFKTYQRQKDELYEKAFNPRMSDPRTREAQQKDAFEKLVALNTRTMKTFLNGTNGILAQVMKKYGGRQMSAQEARKVKTDAQIAADRSTSGAKAGGGTNAKAIPTGAELDQKVTALAKTYHTGSGEPTAAEMIRAEFAIKTGAA